MRYYQSNFRSSSAYPYIYFGESEADQGKFLCVSGKLHRCLYTIGGAAKELGPITLSYLIRYMDEYERCANNRYILCKPFPKEHLIACLKQISQD